MAEMIKKSDAEGAISDITQSFIDAIDEVVTDTELAEKVKLMAQANILQSMIRALIGDNPILPKNADSFFDIGR